MGLCENVVADVLPHDPGMNLVHSDNTLDGFGGTLCRSFMNRVTYASRFHEYEVINLRDT